MKIKWEHRPPHIVELGIILVLMTFVMIAGAFAQDEPNMPRIPDEATKIRALKRAYELNGNSMVGDGRMIDVSKEDLSGAALPPVSELPPKKVKKP